MANETDYEIGQGGSDPSKPMSDPNDPTVKPTSSDETDPMRKPDPARPEDWRDPNEVEKPDEDESSPSNN